MQQAQSVFELEGTWEEIIAHAPELAGRRVHVTVLPPAPEPEHAEPPFSSARSLLQFAGSWAGDDLEECLQAVYTARGPARFIGDY